MSVDGRFAGISRDDLAAAADRAGVGTAPRVIRQVGDAVSAWPDFAAAAMVRARERTCVAEHHQTCSF